MAAVDVTNMLDPEMRGAFEGFTVPPLDAGVLSTLRKFAFPAAPLSDAVARVDHQVPADPPVPVRVHRATGTHEPQPAVVTIHGGGYVIGSYDMDGPLLDRWCTALGVPGGTRPRRPSPRAPCTNGRAAVRPCRTSR